MASSAATPSKAEKINEGQHDDDNNHNRGPVVQYILVRTDLNWATGALIAQACHASVAVIASTLNSPNTRTYLNDIANMHKIILKADGIEDLNVIESKLKESDIDHHLWIEKPENIATCLAVSPQPKQLIQSIFKHLKLLK